MLTSTVVSEARRQLSICNACRYCEGLCAVFVALEGYDKVDIGEVAHLANLCHDCRSCLYACPYSPPHEFAVNPPRLFAQARGELYSSCVTPRVRRRRNRGGAWLQVTWALLAFLVVTTLIAVVSMGTGALVATHAKVASPYDVVPYPAILVEMLLPFVVSCGVLVRSARTYWRTAGTRGGARRGGARRGRRALLDALYEAASLRYLKGGGEPCHVGSNPSTLRRWSHQLISYGFALCLLATITAAALQDLGGKAPPYALWSVPVISGVLGGVGLVTGCSAILATKGSVDVEATDESMLRRDYGLLIALELIGLTGLATLCARSSPAYGALLIVHLATVATAFLVAPYTKFVHWIYRSMALYRNADERRGAEATDLVEAAVASGGRAL